MEGPDKGKSPYIPYEERWELLKPTIISLYLGDGDSVGGMKIELLASHMKEHHSFPAEYVRCEQ